MKQEVSSPETNNKNNYRSRSGNEVTEENCDRCSQRSDCIIITPLELE